MEFEVIEGSGSKTFDEMTEAEQEEMLEYWENTPGSGESYIIKHFEAPAEDIATTVHTLETLYSVFAEDAAACGVRNEFEHLDCMTLLRLLQRRNRSPERA